LITAVTVHADAAAEVDAAAAWYNDQRDGLGLQFLAAVDGAIEHARAWPQSGTPVEDLPADLVVRRLPVLRFPYHLAYLVVSNDRIHILAVAHDHRRPGYWTSRTTP
jgi:toxin ParE1/3/4